MIKAQSGLELEINSSSGDTTPEKINLQGKGLARIMEEDIKVRSLPGLGCPSQDLNKVKFPFTDTTPGSKRRGGERRVQEGERDRNRTAVMMGDSG